MAAPDVSDQRQILQARMRAQHVLELHELLDLAKEAELTRVDLDSQVQAIGFYETLGFAARGGTFMDAGIPHRNMVLPLVSE